MCTTEAKPKILVIDDVETHFKNIKALLVGENFDVFPSDDNEYGIFRTHFQNYYKFNKTDSLYDNAERYLNAIQWNTFSGAIIDWVLDTTDNNPQGYKIYNNFIKIKNLVFPVLFISGEDRKDDKAGTKLLVQVWNDLFDVVEDINKDKNTSQAYLFMKDEFQNDLSLSNKTMLKKKIKKIFNFVNANMNDE
ncbi:MAG: hypothetical protein LBP63_01220 [Prevotellaceae bacterium]|jgi:hypothetical protein|nr:hypothetical protein [Prevotellaceae bacterium]